MPDPNVKLAALPLLPAVEELPRGGILVRAAAKINLSLLVGARRDDGFHSLDSYVAKIGLYDEIRLHRRQDGAICLQCLGADCGPMEKNLSYRAAMLLAKLRGAGGADIHLTKGVPPGKGLGGGSADAAATLTGLCRLWDIDGPAADMAAMAATLGSDVPLFLSGPASRITGRGEIVAPAKVHPFFLVLYLPSYACGTADVYRVFDRLPPQAGEQLDAQPLATRPPSAWRDKLQNQLFAAARKVCPALEADWQRWSAVEELPVCLSGSGSALFVICDSEMEAAAVRERAPGAIRAASVLVCDNNW